MNDGKFPGFSDPDSKPLKKPASTGGKLGGSPGKLSDKPLAATPPSTAPSSSPAAPPTPVVDVSQFEFDDQPSVKRKPTFPNPMLEPVAPAAPGQAAAGQAPPNTPVGTGSRGASAKTAQEQEDADIKPGMAKDLWACIHCGARNKPTRDTCRECGKSPSDEIVVPWHKKPKNLAKIGGGALGVILLFMLVTHHDVSLHPPGPGHLDNKVRMSGGGGGLQNLGESKEFHGRGTVAVSGRVLYVSSHQSAPWLSVVVLALGGGAVSDDALNAGKVDFKDDGFVTTGIEHTVTLFLATPDNVNLKLTKGAYLSIAGEYGDFYEGGTSVPYTSMADHPDSYGVLVKEHAEQN